MIIDPTTQIEGCAALIQFALREKILKKEELKNEDVEKHVEVLAKHAKEYCLQAIVVSEMNNDEQMLIEEDRARDFKRHVKKLDKEIATYLVSIYGLKWGYIF